MTPLSFGTLPSGKTIDAYTLANDAGASLQVLTYGGIVTSLRVPDRQGRLDDIVLGFNDLEAYLEGHPYFGAITGRIAGRVSGGRLSLEGRTFALARNEGDNHLHGGRRGLDKRVWTAQPLARPDGAASLRISYLSPDCEDGYPGSVDIAVTYTLTATNEFIVETEAAADRLTPLSLTHHSYFNLPAALGWRDTDPQGFPDRLASLAGDIGLRATLGATPVPDTALAELAREAVVNRRLMDPNPRPITEVDAIEIYRRTLQTDA